MLPPSYKKIKKLSSLSVVFPAFNDQYSIPILLERVSLILPIISTKYEVIVVNDGSSDQTKEVLSELSKKYKYLKVINHKKNLGYGGAIRSGFKTAIMDYVFYTDGDMQYDVLEIHKLINQLTPTTDFVTGYKLNRSDLFYRKFLGNLYAFLNRKFFTIRIRDVNCDFRLFKKSILKSFNLEVDSGAFDLEFIKKVEEGGFEIREVGVNHYPRPFGSSQALRPHHLYISIRDVFKITFGQIGTSFSKNLKKSKISKVII